MTNNAANDNGVGTVGSLAAHWRTIEGRHARPGYYESTPRDWAAGILARHNFDLAAGRADAKSQARLHRRASGKRSPFSEVVVAILEGVTA